MSTEQTPYLDQSSSPTWKTPSLPARFVDQCTVSLFNATVNSLSASVRRSKWARDRLRGVQVLKDIPFGARSDLTLDIYAPLDATLPSADELSNLTGTAARDADATSSTYPFALYLHGGGFALFSKDSHWSFGLRLAEEGFITFVINYRLTPKHPCPAGLEDCALALPWILNRRDQLRLDAARGLIAGESAGGNLTLALTLCLLRRDPAPWASALFDLEWTPRMIAPACAFLDVSGVGREPDEMHPLFAWRVRSLGRKYLAQSERPDLGEPLAELVAGVTLERECPPVLITIGDNDPVYRDSTRLADELRRREIKHELITYPGGIHSFHAAINKPLAAQCWRDHFDYWATL